MGALGFRTTWVDGKSSYNLGIIYRQEPLSGSYQVPYRTTVILYRTTETAKVEYGCDNPNLTPEEKANCGVLSYSAVSCREVVSSPGITPCSLVEVRSLIFKYVIFQFNNESLVAPPYTYKKIGNNTYIYEDDELYCFEVDNGRAIHPPKNTYIKLLKDGFIYTHETLPYQYPDCANKGVGLPSEGWTSEMIFSRGD